MVRQWEKIECQYLENMTTGKCQLFTKIWKPFLKYLAELWRTRCFYVDKQRLRQEMQSLDEKIAEARKRDYSNLPIVDRRLFEDQKIPDTNSSPDHKKFWLFSIECAYEK